MHMADALLSPGTGAVMYAASAAAMGYAAVKLKKDDRFDESGIPVMAVTGALVFAGQMINFTIPGTGSSGHIGGGILLAAMLGPEAGFLTMAAVLLIQCLFFADGGLLALGCNVFNMGVIPCLIAYPLLFQPIAKKKGRGMAAASILSVVFGLQLGAFCVILETVSSGMVEIPFDTFVLLMQPIHLVIGLVEGAVTALVLAYVYRARPETLDIYAAEAGGSSSSQRKILAVFGIFAILLGTAVSLFASGYPDGLEWALEQAGVTEADHGGIYEVFRRIQEKMSISSGYEQTAKSGLIGGVLTVLLAFLTGTAITIMKKKRKNE